MRKTATLYLACLIAGSSSAQHLETLWEAAPAYNAGFGTAVAVDEVLVIGAPRYDDVAGRVQVFEPTGSTHLFELSEAGTRHYGQELETHGDRILVGAPDGWLQSPGQVYLYDTSGQQLLHLPAPSPATDLSFGHSLAIDGNLALIGAAFSTEGASTRAGCAYLYDLTTGTMLQKFVAPVPGVNHHFGIDVALSGGEVYISEITSFSLEGRVYAFDLNGNYLREYVATGPSPADLFGGEIQAEGGELLVSKGYGAARLFDAATAVELAGMEIPGVAFSRVEMSAQHIAIGSQPNVGLFDRQTRLPIDTITAPAEPEGTVAAFGGAMALFGASLFIGAPGTRFHDTPDVNGAGAVFHMAPGFPMGQVYCTSPPNSTGAAGELRAFGTSLIEPNAVTLQALRLPVGEFAMLLNAPSPGFVVMPGGSDGTLCLSNVGRHRAQLAPVGPAGTAVFPVDITSLPRPTGMAPILSGETWHFQAWHRDGTSSNFTKAFRVTFS